MHSAATALNASSLPSEGKHHRWMNEVFSRDDAAKDLSPDRHAQCITAPA